MTSGQVSGKTGAALRTVNKWAAANAVAYTGEGRRKTYQWTEEDCARFAARTGPGWKKGRTRKNAD